MNAERALVLVVLGGLALLVVLAVLEAGLMRRVYQAAALVAVLVAAVAVVVVTALDGDQPVVPAPPAEPAEVPAPVAVGVDDEDPNTDPDDVIVLDDQARDVYSNATEAPERFDLSGDLRGLDRTPEAVYDLPLATATWPGCDTRMLRANWSDRTARVRAIGLHYTAGANRAGRSDMDGLTAYANSQSAGVSWHFLIDSEGHCYYSVHVSKKAWTIGNLNSQTVNIEVIGTGREATYPAAGPGARKLAEVVRRIGRVFDIPMQLGAVSNCNVTRPGVITHWQGGQCSGGHHDIRPYDIAAVVRQIAVSSGSRKLAKWERSHRIAHAKQRASSCDAECRSYYRERSRKLHRLIARERS